MNSVEYLKLLVAGAASTSALDIAEREIPRLAKTDVILSNRVLANLLGVSDAAGTALHYTLGIGVLPWVFANWIAPKLPVGSVTSGALVGAALWAGVAATSKQDPRSLTVSLGNHLLWGVILGAMVAHAEAHAT